MNLLASLDPGDAVTGMVPIVVFQTAVVILLAALWGRAVFRWRAEARHALWLGTLVLVLISPAVAAIAGRSGVGLWVVTLSATGDGKGPAAEERGPSQDAWESDASRVTAHLSNGSVAAQTEPPREAMAVTRAGPAQLQLRSDSLDL